ncbi:retinol binding protein receptor-domain-containing protein [Zychaea mexicana]|uniref:retinol binding protein receptor-domain-containing protein n=1 Tax=Zychaea mexicana TaxID=64656 RepID=UPI0022FF05C0|nr:retinol binding protein receptor-domain-containing protein [Zychaea mexicana]KAI9484393.1 retinol binding protein receptor-domain-containing protein [Zychaea mexicana]
MMILIIILVIAIWLSRLAHAVGFTTQCWEKLNGKANLLKDGLCQQINQDDDGWQTYQSDDWIYYPQQYVNVSLTETKLSVASVGGCCAPNRWKPAGSVFKDDGDSYEETGGKIVGISDAPLVQTIAVNGAYMHYMTDDHAMNFTLLPSVEMADKQSIFYGLAIDRAVIITYQYRDANRHLLGNYSTGVLRNDRLVEDVTLPPHTRYIEIALYGSRANPLCFSYIYAGLYVDKAKATVTKICSTMATILQYLALVNFILVPACFAVMTFVLSSFQFPPPVRFLCRQPSHPLNLCIFIAIGSFIFSQAWNLINSQSSIFDEWLPRAAKIIELFLSFFLYAVYFYPVFLCYSATYRSRTANLLGLYTTLVLFGLRVVIDLPSFVITYARDVPFLVLSIIIAAPAIVAYTTIVVFFLIRIFTFRSCTLCRLKFLEVSDIEEQYVRKLFGHRDFQSTPIRRTWYLRVYNWLTSTNKQQQFPDRLLSMDTVRWFFGTDKYVRIPFAVKASLTLLLYCLAQLIPVLLVQMVGVGGVVPVHLCAWSPYLTQLQYHPDPMTFAVKSFMLMQIAVFVATLGAGGLCVGFGFTGTLYFMLEVSLIGTGIAMLIQLDHLRDAILQRVGYGIFVMSFFIAFVVQIIQKRITRMLFIKSGTRFSLQNRAPLLHYWYFMMFTSMTRALTSYIIRTLKLVLRYPLFSLRVDRNAETWSVRRGDGGFVGYCGMLLAEHEYNNPIMLVFLECLLPCLTPPEKDVKSCPAHQRDPEMSSGAVAAYTTTNDKYPIASRAKTRWFLAYTLINNPMLRRSRKRKQESDSPNNDKKKSQQIQDLCGNNALD